MGFKRKNKSSASKRQGHTSSNPTHDNGAMQQQPDEDDVRGIKKWIDALSFDAFANALEFTFHTNNGESQPNVHEKEGRKRQHKYQQRQASGDLSACASQEYDLLMEMLAIQRGLKLPTTAIDADKCWYGKGHPLCNTEQIQHLDNWRDGIDYCYGLHRTLKWGSSPCMFRWIDPTTEQDESSLNHSIYHDLKRSSTALDSNDSTNDTVDRGRPKTSQLHTNPLPSLAIANSLPSDLLAVLEKAGVKRSTSALLETFNEIDELDEAFEDAREIDTATADTDRACSFTDNLCIQARQWIASDGRVLGAGTTEDQENADAAILRWTALVWDKDSSHGNGVTTKKSATSKLPHCRLIFNDSTKDEERRKKVVLTALNVTSRGQFLSKTGEGESQWAPWFDPTQQWFSLPMYLASRLEASLWQSYLGREDAAKANDKSNEGSLVQSVKDLDADARARVLTCALGAAVKEDLLEKCQQINNSQSTEAIRDSLLWGLLLSNDGCSSPASDELNISPLFELGTFQFEIKSKVLKHLQEGFSHEVERTLLSSEADDIIRNGNLSKKKKKKRVQRKRAVSVDASLESGVVRNEKDHSSDDDNDDDDDDPRVETILHVTSAGVDVVVHDSFASLPPTTTNATPLEEVNIAKMAALTVIDEILSDVFDRVGLESDETTDFAGATTVVTHKKASRNVQRGVAVSKTSGKDDIEVATTAVISNKGFGVNAAVNLLRRIDDERRLSQSSSVQSQQLWASRTRHDGADSDRPHSSMTRGPKYRLPRDVTSVPDSSYQSDLRRSRSSGNDRDMDKKAHLDLDEQIPNIHTLHQPARPQSRHQRVSSFIEMKSGLHWASLDSAPLFPQASKEETSIFDGTPLCLTGALDGWNGVACSQQGETDIFTEILEHNHCSDDKKIGASSTAASLASSHSCEGDTGLDIDGDGNELISLTGEDKAVQFKGVRIEFEDTIIQQNPTDLLDHSVEIEATKSVEINRPLSPARSDSVSWTTSDQSPTPPAPPTPPPQLSPVLVSLADLGKLREDAVASGDVRKSFTRISPTPLSLGLSLPDSPGVLTNMKRTLTPSISRDDLRSIDERRRPPRRDRDLHQSMGHRQVDALLSYRNVVAQSVHRKASSLHSCDGKPTVRDDIHPISTRSIRTTRTGAWAPGPDFPSLGSSAASMSSYKEPMINKILHLELACARSESALDGVEDASHCNVIPRTHPDDTMTKDGATTISSVHSPHHEEEQVATLREERDNYRDICLTLGAENAKLRNLLAAKMCSPLYNPTSFAPETIIPAYMYQYSSYDIQFSPTTLLRPNAMSDAGANRGDQESTARSEDETEVHPSVIGLSETQNSVSWQAHGDSAHSVGHRTSGGGTCAESDVSLDHNIGGQEPHAFAGFRHIHHQDSFFGPIPLHGMQSRLSTGVMVSSLSSLFYYDV